MREARGRPNPVRCLIYGDWERHRYATPRTVGAVRSTPCRPDRRGPKPTGTGKCARFESTLLCTQFSKNEMHNSVDCARYVGARVHARSVVLVTSRVSLTGTKHMAMTSWALLGVPSVSRMRTSADICTAHDRCVCTQSHTRVYSDVADADRTAGGPLRCDVLFCRAAR